MDKCISAVVLDDLMWYRMEKARKSLKRSMDDIFLVEARK